MWTSSSDVLFSLLQDDPRIQYEYPGHGEYNCARVCMISHHVSVLYHTISDMPCCLFMNIIVACDCVLVCAIVRLYTLRRCVCDTFNM